jgi:hypothetical protein
MKVSNIPTAELAEELCSRPDVVGDDDMMIWPVYQLFCRYGVIPCTDGVAVRRNAGGAIEALAIRRGTGCFKGRFCSIGGRILRGESIEECLRRQFRSDVGSEIELLVSWKSPVDIGQCYPLENPLSDPWPKDFGPEDNKHANSMYYPVRLLGDIILGATAHGGQEAMEVRWFTLEILPPPDQFGYDQHPKFVACMEAAEHLI